MKPQRVFAVRTAGTSGKSAFRASTYHNQPAVHLSYKDLIKIETGPSKWRRAVDHSAEVVVFFQLDLLGTVPRLTKSVRICRDAPGRKGSGRHLVPAVYVGDMLMEDTYVKEIIGQRFLVDEDDVMKLLERADLLYTREEQEDEEMDTNAQELEEEDSSPTRVKGKIGQLTAIGKSTPSKRPKKRSIRHEERKLGGKRKNRVDWSDRESASVEKSATVPAGRKTKTRNAHDGVAKMQKKRGPSQEEDSSLSNPDYSSTEGGPSAGNRRHPPRSARITTRRLTPFPADAVRLADERSPGSSLPADDDADVTPLLGHGKSQSQLSRRNASAMGDTAAAEEEETDRIHNGVAASVDAKDNRTCTQCKTSHASAKGLVRHVKEVHLKLGRLPCPECRKPILPRNMPAHLQSHKSGTIGTSGRRIYKSSAVF